MFCTISLIDSKKRFSKNIIIKEEKIGDIEYLKVLIRKLSLLNKVEKKLKNKVDKAILSENIDLNSVNFKNLNLYDCRFYLKEVAKTTFIKIINLTEIPANKISVCVVDKNCEYSDFIYSLVDKCSVIRIVTNSIEKYSQFAEEIYSDFGMKPIITSIVDNSDIGIDLSCDEPKVWFNNYNNYVQITNKCIKIGVGFRKLVPPGINQCDFASVLQNYNDFSRLNLVDADLLLRFGKFYEINRNNIKNFLDNK